ncbi:MAG TPA: pyruvate dehydrogenase (acetyl-transferring) E1 component subunit alpha [Pyrinomonadaceae bacterium]|nr:pyruvate dehydrogenase (acetyl-transferring) E1 component subunit alpha [Pyrinomonadaceae bacterium]
MTKPSAAPPSAAGAEEQSSTGVIDPPKDVDKKKLAKERDQAKERQKDRLSALEPAQLIDLYRQMTLIRRFEEKAAEVYVAGKIGGFCHLYIGQEAVAVGSISALRPDDYVLGSYREHGQALAKGMSARAIMAELYGKVTGCSKGKGGSMHMFDKELNFLGGHAIVGGQIPLATGIAFASKYKGTDQVTICYFGEAAVNQGAFHESLNMAQLWKLPCIYICENNQYGMGTSVDRAMSLRDIAQKSCAYEIASEFVDGMDVLAIREATLRAVERARKDYLPTLLEIRTYRFMGHSMSDPGNYRTRAEIEKYQERDPIKLFVASLLEEKITDQETLDKIDREVREEVEDSVKFAEESPLPPPEDLYTDVYANPIDPAKNRTA